MYTSTLTYLVFIFMLPNGYVKFKYKHVAFRHWPTKLKQFKWWLPTYLPCKMVNLPHNAYKITRKNHQNGLKSGMEFCWPCLKAFCAKSFETTIAFHCMTTLVNFLWDLLKKIMSGLYYVKTTQSQIGQLVVVLCPCIF